jgi:RHS repeat-associated protein
MGRIILHAQATPSNCGTAAWPVNATYDLAGNMTSITYPSGRKVINQYDAANRLNLVQYQSWQGVTYYYGTYNYLNVTDFFPSGAPKSVTLGSGMGESYQFNSRLQPSRDTVNVPGGATFLDRVYGYGTQNNGNVMSVADQLNSAYTQNFTYDPLNRLGTAGEAGNRWGLSFGYDAWGNFLQQTVTAGTASGHNYAAMATNRLLGYTYDAAGNMTADDHHQYAYDGENRITTVDTTAAKYGYDANGNRVRKDVGSNYTEYIYFGSEIIAEHDQAGGWSDYIFANGKRIAKADDYEHQIQVSGQVCSACGTQTYSLAFSNLGSLAGHVIQSGDILRWQQWQNTGTFGGITVNLTDGTKSVTIGSAANQWQSFAVDLSTLQGKTISSIALYEDPSTQPGTWTIYYQDIVFTAANGTVQPLFSQNPTVPALTGSGTSGVTNVTTAIHVCLDPGCAPSNTTTYYHGDQIGSSRILSNGHGYPVWQGTFLPFGEEYNLQITDNHYKFNGKERDAETGLDYFGARYYSNGLGRFASVDPSKLSIVFSTPQTWNRYSYVYNNPLRLSDDNGKWPTDIHNRIIDNSFPTLTPHQRQILKDVSAEQDSILGGGQGNGASYQHAMRGPDQTVEQAQTQFNDFVESSEQSAQNAQMRFWMNDPDANEDHALSDQALADFASALHAILDSTSPAHEGFQVWDWRNPALIVRHHNAEKTINGQQMQGAVSAARNAFNNTFGGLFGITVANPTPKPNPEPNPKRRTDPPCLKDRQTGGCV